MQNVSLSKSVFLGKIRKNVLNGSSAELAQRAVMVKVIQIWQGNVLYTQVVDYFSFCDYFMLCYGLEFIPGVVGCGKGDGYLMSLGCPTDICFQLGKACYPFSRQG